MTGVPLPATWLLLAIDSAGMMAVRRSRKPGA